MDLKGAKIVLNNAHYHYKKLSGYAILAIQNMKKVKNFDKKEVSLLVITSSYHCCDCLSMHKNIIFI